MASPFSGKAGRTAAMWAANQATQGLGQIMGTLTDAERRAGNYLGEGYETSMDALDTGYAGQLEALRTGYRDAPGHLTLGRESARGDIIRGADAANYGLQTAANAGIDAISGTRNLAYGNLMGPGGAADVTRAGYGRAIGDVNQYYGQGANALQGAAGAYDPLIQRGMAGYDMYSNSLGLNGAAGNAAARGAFQTGPGYEWQVEQATDAAQRAANRTGGLYGGNTTDAVTRLGSNLANQEYGAWQNRLAPYQGAALSATSGKAAQLDQLAQMYGQQGTGLANLETGQAKDLTGIYGRAGDLSVASGKQIADIYGTSGKQIADNTMAAGRDLAGNQIRTGAALAALQTGQGTEEAKIGGDYYSGLANLAGGYGGSMASLITGTAGNIAQAEQAANNTITQSGTQGLLAGQQASANTWGAILGGLGAGAKLLGGGTTGSGVGSLLTSLFK